MQSRGLLQISARCLNGRFGADFSSITHKKPKPKLKRNHMKRIKTHVLIAAIVLGITTGVVFAASVHFKNSPKVTATDNGITLTTCAALTGLGNGDVTIAVTATAT